MFSGLSNQVSSWMGKKGEEGQEVPPNEADNPVAEVGLGEEKSTSPTKGNNKLDMLAGVKSQMSGWLAGGIPSLGRGAAPSEEESKTESGSAATTAAPGGSEKVKDDDASSATGGADSGPGSPTVSPGDDKEKQFGAVSTKAFAGAKSFGGFLYNAASKAGKSVVEGGVKIKKIVGENKLISDLNKEQDAFIANKSESKSSGGLPWEGMANGDNFKEECLALSTDRRNFVRAPPPGVDFPYDFEEVQPVATALLAADANLESMRFELVPKIISEENFWRNYFYRLSLLKQSYEAREMPDSLSENVSDNQG